MKLTIGYIPGTKAWNGEKLSKKIPKNKTFDIVVKECRIVDVIALYEALFENIPPSHELSYIPRRVQDNFVRELLIKGLIKLDDIPINYIPMRIQLGLCCINSELRIQKIFTSRKPILKTVAANNLQYLQDLCLQNLRDLIAHIEWNVGHGIRVFRVSSGLFPHMANMKLSLPEYNLDFARSTLKEIGTLVRRYKQRITTHPGQFNVIGTADDDIFTQTARELEHHAEVFDAMELDQDSVMTIHGGGIYGDKSATIRRWIKNFARLPERVRRRLVIENCEKCFNIEDCLYISKEVNIPVVFDTHHYQCYKKLHVDSHPCLAEENYIEAILHTWSKRNIKPKFHISEQGSGKTGHHSDYVETIPHYLLDIPKKYKVDIDIMIEASAKEKAVFHLYDKYPVLNPANRIIDYSI